MISVRHWCYDVGIFSKQTFDLPVICVGNITVGGTGKTPVVEYLIRHLSPYYRVAVLSRGYGRKTKGYMVVEPGMSFLRSGDEPKYISKYALISDSCNSKSTTNQYSSYRSWKPDIKHNA